MKPSGYENTNRYESTNVKVRRDDLVHPELSYQVVGALFDVYNSLGHGHLERTYQRAVALALRDKNLPFREQVLHRVSYRGAPVGKYFLDFVVDEKVVLELKQGVRLRKGNIEQVNAYLRSSGLKLAILANFTKQGVLFRRIVNLDAPRPIT